jgi:hypothetical protein
MADSADRTQISQFRLEGTPHYRTNGPGLGLRVKRPSTCLSTFQEAQIGQVEFGRRAVIVTLVLVMLSAIGQNDAEPGAGTGSSSSVSTDRRG